MNFILRKKLNLTAFILFIFVAIWIYFFKCNLVEDLRFLHWNVRFHRIPFKDTLLNSPVSAFDVLVEIMNVLGFSMFGFIAYPLFKKHPFIFTVIISFLFSLIIEMLQLGLRFGTPIISDIFLNTIGGVIGCLVYRAFEKVKISEKVWCYGYIILIIIFSICVILGVIFTSLKWPEYTYFIYNPGEI